MSGTADAKNLTPGMIIMPDNDGYKYIGPDPAMIRILEKIVDQNSAIVDALGRAPMVINMSEEAGP